LPRATVVDFLQSGSPQQASVGSVPGFDDDALGILQWGLQRAPPTLYHRGPYALHILRHGANPPPDYDFVSVAEVPNLLSQASQAAAVELVNGVLAAAEDLDIGQLLQADPSWRGHWTFRTVIGDLVMNTEQLFPLGGSTMEQLLACQATGAYRLAAVFGQHARGRDTWSDGGPGDRRGWGGTGAHGDGSDDGGESGDPSGGGASGGSGGGGSGGSGGGGGGGTSDTAPRKRQRTDGLQASLPQAPVLMVTSRSQELMTEQEAVVLQRGGLVQAVVYPHTAEDVKAAMLTWCPRALLISTMHHGTVCLKLASDPCTFGR
jgi:hypothetical protein